MSQKSGFTLVELLAVIAIIAVLAALLFPVFTTARQASTASVCASNLRQLNKATLLYTQDYDECFPLAFYRTVGANGTCLRTVWGVLQPYLRDYRVALCPADPQPIDLTAMRAVRGVGCPLCTDEPTQVSLIPNWCLTVNAASYPAAPPVSVAQLPFPASTSSWSDSWMGAGVSAAGFEPLSGIDPRHTLTARVPDRVVGGHESRYRGKVQASFVDGHVQAFHARLEPDVRRVGDFVQINVRPVTIDNRQMPRWFIQGGVYHNRPNFYGWPSRPKPSDPNRMLLTCYPRPNFCEEWD